MEALRGNRDEAFCCARKFLEIPGMSRDAWRGANPSATLAFVHTWTGDKAAACDEITRLLQVPVDPIDRFPGRYPCHSHSGAWSSVAAITFRSVWPDSVENTNWYV